MLDALVIHTVLLTISRFERVRVAWSEDRSGYAIALTTCPESQVYDAAAQAARPTSVGELNALPCLARDAFDLADEFFAGRNTARGDAVRARRAADEAAIERALAARS